MTLTRRLLSAGGGGGSFTLPPGLFDLTSAPDGGWTQINAPKAVYHAGYTYFGYVDGTSGDVEVRAYRHSDGVVSSAIALHGSALDTPPDTHDAPSLLVMDTGYLIVTYSAHDGGSLYTRTSTSTVDADPMLADGFAAEATAKSGGVICYPFIMQRLAEANDPVYIWYRSASGAGTTLSYVKSTNHGSTWSAEMDVYASGAPSYWKIATDSQWRIDFFVSDSNPQEASSSIFHFYADDEDYKQTDGTPIVPGGALYAPADLTEVYDSSDGPAWVTDACLDGSNLPRLVMNIDNGSLTDSEFRFASADAGGVWTSATILASVGFGVVDPSPVAALDGSRCFLVRYIGGHHELWRYVTGDGGSTWTGTAVTSSSAVDNLYPATVQDHAADLAILWLAGDYTGADTAFDMGIRGTP